MSNLVFGRVLGRVFHCTLWFGCLIGLWVLSRQFHSMPQLGQLTTTLLRTLFQASLSASVAVGLGLLWAYSGERAAKRWQPPWLLSVFSTLPVLPTLVVVLMIVAAFGRQGLFSLTSLSIYSLAGIVCAHVFMNAPWVMMQCRAQWRTLPIEQQRLAQNLGFSAWQQFTWLYWPRVRPLMMGQWWLVFALCFTSFAVVLVLGGTRWATLEVAIYQSIKLDFDLARAALIAAVQILCLLPMLWVMRSGARGWVRDGGSVTQMPSHSAASGIWLLISLGFLLPMLALVIRASGASIATVLWDPQVGQALLTSLLIGVLSSTLASGLGWVLAHYVARGGSASAGWIGFLIPAQVLALTLFLGFQMLGWRHPGLAVVISNALMGLPFALLILVPLVSRQASQYDRLCAHLNLRGWNRLMQIEWPQQRPALLWVWVFVLGLSLGDFGVVALFGSTDFITLPYLLYAKLGSYRTHDAFALAFWMWCLVWFLFVLAAYLARRQHSLDPVLGSDHAHS